MITAPDVPGRDRVARATIGDQLRRHAQHTPDKEAVVFLRPDGTREVHTYGSLNDRVNRFAAALVDAGVGRGDVVAMMSRNSPDYVTAFYAALKLGAAFTGINFTYKQPEVTYQVEHCKPKVVIVEDVFAEAIAGFADTLDPVGTFVVSDVTAPGQAPDGWLRFSDLVDESRPADEPDADVSEDDVAMLQYTSGTEAFPKGVMIPHRNYLISTTPAWMAALGIKPEDRWLFLMPFFAIAGLGSMTSLTLLGATLILVHSIDPKQAIGIMAEEGVTLMAQTPAFYLGMTRQEEFADADFGALERCLTYGGTVPRAMVDAWQQVKPDLVWGTYWGQSELSQLGSVGWFRTLEDIPGGDATWIGTPVPQLEIRVVDGNGDDAEVGELLARSPSTMLGYLDDPERTAATIRDGWLHTGDMVRIDDDGNLFFYDRVKDMIKTGGMNVSSQEVERVLFDHPAVVECGVVGLPDEYWSEAVTAFVVLADDAEATGEEIIAHCKEAMAGYKVPKAVHVVDALPRDTQGKLLKRELRSDHAD